MLNDSDIGVDEGSETPGEDEASDDSDDEFPRPVKPLSGFRMVEEIIFGLCLGIVKPAHVGMFPQ